MLEKLHGVSNRIADLKRKLKAREGKAEFKDNVKDIRAEIERLENVSLNRQALMEFVESESAPVASSEVQEEET